MEDVKFLSLNKFALISLLSTLFNVNSEVQGYGPPQLRKSPAAIAMQVEMKRMFRHETDSNHLACQCGSMSCKPANSVASFDHVNVGFHWACHTDDAM